VEKIKTGVLTENELDKLLKESFLDLDLKASANVRMLDMVAGHQLRNRGISSFLNADRWNLIVLLFCLSACLNSFYTFIDQTNEHIKPATNPSYPVIAVHMNIPVSAVTKSSPVKNKINLKARAAISKDKKTRAKPKSFVGGSNIPLPDKATEPAIVLKADSTSDQTNNAINNSQAVEPPTVQPVVNRQPAASAITRNVIEAKAEPATSKAKKVRKKRRSVFHRNGTFIMKSGKYRKSSRI
jgi:hypothetical protein